MEEDIKILENKIKISRDLFNDIGSHTYLDEAIMQTIENLIERYKETKQELESVKEIYYTQKEIETNYIKKSKVKEKIEELEQDVKDFEEYWSKDPRRFKRQQCIDYYKLEALQELLED